MELTINGRVRRVDVPVNMPVLWVLRDVLGMTGTRFGCGMALCGACTVQLDGQAIRSCVTPVSAAAGKAITTIEAIGATAVGKKVQEAWIALDVKAKETNHGRCDVSIGPDGTIGRRSVQ
jgi:isoquinoline 1-oxidoreductase subunit alpha